MVPQENSVAIVMPCLNEAATISSCVDRAQVALRMLAEKYQLSGEVIVADNGSTDGSQDIATQAGARVVDVTERGYGAALIGGFAASNAAYLVMGDSDCSYDFVEAVPMVGCLIDGADLCMGNRFRGEIKPGAMPWKNRYIGNPTLSGILRFLFRTKIGDAHCGLRAIRKDALERLALSSTGMEFASEMVLKSVLQEFTVAETPGYALAGWSWQGPSPEPLARWVETPHLHADAQPVLAVSRTGTSAVCHRLHSYGDAATFQRSGDGLDRRFQIR